MLLSNIPSDVFRSILLHLTTTEILELIATCRPIHGAFKHYNVVSEWTHTLHPQQWLPRVVYKLPKLCTVSLDVSNPRLDPNAFSGLKHPLDLGLHLQLLEVRGPGAISPFLDRSKQPPAQPLKHGAAPLTRWIKLQDMLPQLKSLVIVEFNTLKTDLELPNTFPRPLTSLQVEVNFIQRKRLTFPTLAELTSLTHLQLNPIESDSQIEILVKRLPCLTSLHLRQLHNLDLPPTLTSLKVMSTDSASDLRAFSDLRRISLGFGILNPLPLDLPSGLTSISAHTDNFERFCNALPPTVTRVHMRSYPRSREFIFLPESVIHFRTSSDLGNAITDDIPAYIEQCSAKHWLPPRLKTLDVARGFAGLLPTWWSLLPQSLEILGSTLSLERNKSDIQVQVPVDLRKMFPRLKGSLKLQCRYGPAQTFMREWIFPLGIEEIEIQFYLRERVELGVSCAALLENPIDRWPPALKKLSLQWRHYPRLLTSFEHLPPLLEEVEVIVYGREGGNFELSIGPWAPSLINLPRSLTKLSLIGFDVNDPKTALCHLPATLRVLECKRLSSFDDELAALLPPKLESLCIRKSTFFSDVGIARLPRSMTSLELRLNRAITPRALHVCPPSLTTLHIPRNRNFPKSKKSEVEALLVQRKMGMSIKTRFLKLD